VTEILPPSALTRRDRPRPDVRDGETVLGRADLPCSGVSRMRRDLASTLLLATLGACEDHYVSSPPVGPESYPAMSSSSRVAALFGPPSADASAPVSASPAEVTQALRITSCSSSSGVCPTGAADASADGTYWVVYGSGRGVVRSHEQAKADLYQELRNRTASGQRLNAQPHTPGDAQAPPGLGKATTRAGGGDADPLTTCTIQLLDVVDQEGEVSINVVHGSHARGCLVSLGGSVDDDGRVQCLMKEPEQPKRQGGRRGR